MKIDPELDDVPFLLEPRVDYYKQPKTTLVYEDEEERKVKQEVRRCNSMDKVVIVRTLLEVSRAMVA